MFLLNTNGKLVGTRLRRDAQFLTGSVQMFPNRASGTCGKLGRNEDVALGSESVLVDGRACNRCISSINKELRRCGIGVGCNSGCITDRSLINITPARPGVSGARLVTKQFVGRVSVGSRHGGIILDQDRTGRLYGSCHSLINGGMGVDGLGFRIMKVCGSSRSHGGARTFVTCSAVGAVCTGNSSTKDLRFAVGGLGARRSGRRFRGGCHTDVGGGRRTTPSSSHAV